MLVFDMFQVTSMIAMTLLKSSFWCIIIKFMVIICGDICMVYNILGVKHSPPSGQLSLVLQLHPKDVYITTYISLHINLKLMYATFCQFFIFSPNDSPSKTTENVLHFIQKALFVLEMFNFLFFFPLFHTLQIQKNRWKWNYVNFWNNSKTVLYYIIKLGQIIHS